jgi:hypothetical protein
MAKSNGRTSSSDDLFQLIKSLTQNEKRYVQVFSPHGKSDKNYLLMFNAIDAEQHYDEKAFKQKHEGAPFNGQYFTQNKGNLKSNILRAMRACYEQSTVEDDVLTRLKDYQFLREKGLYKQAMSILKKARKIANDNYLDHLLLQINEIESRTALKHESKRKDLEAKLASLLAEQFSLRERLRIEYSYVNLYRQSQLNYVLGRKELVREQLDELITVADPEYMLQNPEKYSFQTRLSYLMTRALHDLASGNTADFHQTYRKILDIFDKDKVVAANNQLQYVKLTSNYLTACHEVGIYHEFQAIIQKLKEIAKNKVSRHLRGEIMQSLCLNEALLYMNHNNWYEAAAIPDQVKELFDNFDDCVSESRKMTLAYNSMIIQFFLEQWEQVSYWRNWLLEEQSKGIRADIAGVAMIMDVIYWIEIDDSVVESSKRRANRKLGKGPSTKLLNKLKKIVDSPLFDRPDQFTLLATFLKESLYNPKPEINLNGYKEMYYWAMSRAKSISIIEAKKQYPLY